MKIDPRGIMRTVKDSVWGPSGTKVFFVECDHVGDQAPHFAAPKSGEHYRCYHCGVEAREARQ